MSDSRRYRLIVWADPLADGLLRILGVVAVQPVRLLSAQHQEIGFAAATALELVVEQPKKAALLEARLRQLVWVREVQLQGLTESPMCAAATSNCPAGAPVGLRANSHEA